MDNQCCSKKTKRGSDEKKRIISRLNRISGQINGITKMIENDAYCNDVLIQLSAIDKAIKSLANLVLDSHMHTCLIERVNSGDYEAIDEVVDLFKRFQ